MLKKYKIDNYANFWSCTVEIDADHILEEFSEPGKPYTTLMLMEQMILYWHEGDCRLAQNNGDVIKTFLQQLAREVFLIIVENRCNLLGVLVEFKQREGWHLMDGTVGIKITDMDELVFDHEDFEVEEVV